MTTVRRQIPVCIIIINTLYTKLKCVFYGSNELILPFFNSDISFTSLLLVDLVNSLKRTPFKRVFVIFFYLHAGEQGKTRSSCHWQSTFPPWPRGKGNCLQDCPHRLTLVLGGSRTGQVQLRLVGI